MLGRQQIAGIPTAISELFKNAHDAYADRVEVDFYRSDGLFVLRDDGVGMSKDDFEERWLTLGTESKLDLAGLAPPPVDPDKVPRPVLGEKGIGRLAIASIGPQVLVITRPQHELENRWVTACFIHWGIFEVPGIDLEDIEIPVYRFQRKLPTKAEVQSMVDSYWHNFEKFGMQAGPEILQKVRSDLDQFIVDPEEIDGFLREPSLRGNGHGTHFIIIPTDESLIASLDDRGSDYSASALTKMLIGFTNTMTPGHPDPIIQTAFRDHKSDDIPDDIIAESEFFTPYEFENADHRLQGTFDEFGQFRGTVWVYGEPTEDHIVPWPARGRPTECGRFSIDLAVVQGVARESTVPAEEWGRIRRKLDRIGGLYIYKNGIRVLPYGNNDYDFLEIERRRTQSAYYYYFSYRRMFGVVQLDNKHNAALTEKAGREGFRENTAYRQFRDILKNFFIQIAADFFRRDAPQGERYEKRRDELDRLERARRKREQLVTARRRAFAERLEAVLNEIADGQPTEKATEVLLTLEQHLDAARKFKDPDRAAVAILDAESEARSQLSALEERYRIAQPRGIGLSRQLRRDLDAYRDSYEDLQGRVFKASLEAIEANVVQAARDRSLELDRRIRFDRALGEITEKARRAINAEGQSARAAAQSVAERVTDLSRESLGAVDQTINQVLSTAAETDVSALSDDAFVEQRLVLEHRVEEAVERYRGVLSSLLEQLSRITWTHEESGDLLTEADYTEAIEEEVLALRERTEADLELAQLGMAIQVINHEFDATIRVIRQGLRELGVWADTNERLRSLYERIRGSFEHLDSYLSLFTPLQRRLYRTKIEIKGSEILKFLEDLFEERLKRHNVGLEASTRFRNHKLEGYPSTFYPVFVNLVDNAMFWLKDAPEPRIIRMDARSGSFFVSDNGPGVAARDWENIFELGFTRKPGGRGMGLYISRQVLAHEGYALNLVEPLLDKGTTFCISPEQPSSQHAGEAGTEDEAG